MKLFSALIICLVIIRATDALKILVYSPLFGHSHSNYLGKIADTLTERGHNVTVVAPVLDARLKKTGVSLTKDVRVIPSSQRIYEMMEQNHKTTVKALWAMKNDPISMMSMFNNFTIMFAESCKNIISNDKLLNDLRDEKYDIGIAEPLLQCPFAIFEYLNISTTIAALSTTYSELVSDFIGEPVFPSFVPGSMSTAGTKLGFWDRFYNAFHVYVGKFVFVKSFEAEEKIIQVKFGENFKGFRDLIAQASYIFTNSHPYLSYPRPSDRKTVEVGGIVVDKALRSNKNLGEFDQILNERKKNVLVSFGSVAKSKDMPEEYKKSLLAVFEEMKDVTFIWKYEEDTDIADHLPNVHLVKWMPQVALLNDPRLNLFITHGGLGSTTEVAYLGKPAVFIPLFADQPGNAVMASRFGGAITLEKQKLKEKDEVLKALKTILEDPTYKENAEKLAFILNNSPNSGKEQIIKHVEFAGKVGKISNLESNARNLNVFQYYLLDVLTFVLFSIVVIILIIFIIIRKLIQLCLGTKKSKVE